MGCRVVARGGLQGGLPMRLKKTTYAAGSSGSGGALEFIPMAQLNRPTPAIDGGLAAAAHTHASEPMELPTTTACAAGKATDKWALIRSSQGSRATIQRPRGCLVGAILGDDDLVDEVLQLSSPQLDGVGVGGGEARLGRVTETEQVDRVHGSAGGCQVRERRSPLTGGAAEAVHKHHWRCGRCAKATDLDVVRAEALECVLKRAHASNK